MRKQISSSLPVPLNPFQAQHWIVVVLGAILALTVWYSDSNVFILKMVQANLSGLGEPFWTGITLLGDALVGPLFLIPFLKRRPHLVWEGTLAALVATIMTHMIKPLTDVPRPPATLDLAVMGPRLMHGSFPSGHTTTAFTVLGLLVVLGLIRGLGPIVMASSLAVIIGLSRIVAGVHWPADMLMGIAAGWGSALIAIFLAQRWPKGGQGWPLRLQWGLLIGIALFDLLGHDTGYGSGVMLQRVVALIALLWLAWDAIEGYYSKDNTA
jgi:membrane-associated phospholipid phosphatase